MAELPAARALDAARFPQDRRARRRASAASSRPADSGVPGPGAQDHQRLAQRLHLRLRPAPGGRRRRSSSRRRGSRRPDFVVPGGGAKVVQALAAGQVLFALGDSNHPLKITEKGKDALMIFATDTRCSYANIVVRKELFDKGVKTRRGARRREAGGPQGGDRGHRHRLRDLRLRRVRAQEHQGGRRQAGQRPRRVGRRRRRLDHDARRPQGGQVRRDHGRARVAVGGRGRGLRPPHLRRPGREGVEPRLRRAHPGDGGLRAQGDHREVARPGAGLRQCLLPRAAVDPQAPRTTRSSTSSGSRTWTRFKREVVLESVRYYQTIFDWDFVDRGEGLRPRA